MSDSDISTTTAYYNEYRCNGGLYSECDTGFAGWTCLQCDTDNGYIDAGNSCYKCPQTRAEIAVYITFAFIIIVIVFGFSICYGVNSSASAKGQLDIAKKRETIESTKELKYFDYRLRAERKITRSGVSQYLVPNIIKIRLLIIDLQTIAKIVTIWSRQWSPVFSDVLQFLDILNMDFIQSTGILCLQYVSFYTRILYCSFITIYFNVGDGVWIHFTAELLS